MKLLKPPGCLLPGGGGNEVQQTTLVEVHGMAFRTRVRLPSAPLKKDGLGHPFLVEQIRKRQVRKPQSFRTRGAKGPVDLCSAPTEVKRRPTPVCRPFFSGADETPLDKCIRLIYYAIYQIDI